MNVATFPPASLDAQLTELKRERAERTRRYPMEVARRTLHERNAELQNRGLDGAIATLEKIVAASGQPGRRELIEALRESLLYLPVNRAESAALRTRVAEMLAKVPE